MSNKFKVCLTTLSLIICGLTIEIATHALDERVDFQ